MSVFAKVYLWITVGAFVLGLMWSAMALLVNVGWVEVVVLVPRLDVIEPFEHRRYEIRLAGLLAGWIGLAAMLIGLAIRFPSSIRSAARTRRRIRELEREVLELRTLPLRQHEEDDLLMQEAHLEPLAQRVMTQKMRLDELDLRPRDRRPGYDGDAA